MQAIAATSYDGYVGHEYRPKGDAVDSLAHAFSRSAMSEKRSENPPWGRVEPR